MARSFGKVTIEGSDFDEAKFVEMMLYVADRYQGHPLYGATKLNKVLFEADFQAYAELGSSISGATYQALEYGPAPIELLPTRSKLEQSGEIAIDRRGMQHRVVPLREPNLDLFTADEISLVDEAIHAYRDLDKDQTSDRSHRFIGWEAAIAQGEGTRIPYETVFVSDEPLDQFEESIVRSAIKHYEGAH